MGDLKIPKNKYKELVELIEDALYGQWKLFGEGRSEYLKKVEEGEEVYIILHTIEWLLKMEKDRRSWERIKEELIPHQMVEVVMPDDRYRVNYINLLKEPKEEQKEIYEKLKKCSTFKGKAYNSRGNGVQKKECSKYKTFSKKMRKLG